MIKPHPNTAEIQTRAVIVFSGRDDFVLMFDDIDSMDQRLKKYKAMPSYMHHKLEYRVERGEYKSINEADMRRLLEYKKNGS